MQMIWLLLGFPFDVWIGELEVFLRKWTKKNTLKSSQRGAKNIKFRLAFDLSRSSDIRMC